MIAILLPDFAPTQLSFDSEHLEDTIDT
jgi:hypothetical protein